MHPVLPFPDEQLAFEGDPCAQGAYVFVQIFFTPSDSKKMTVFGLTSKVKGHRVLHGALLGTLSFHV